MSFSDQNADFSARNNPESYDLTDDTINFLTTTGAGVSDGTKISSAYDLCNQIVDITTPPHSGAQGVDVAVDQDVLGHGDPFRTLATASENSPQARRCSPSAPRPLSVSRYVRLLLPCTTDHSLDR